MGLAFQLQDDYLDVYGDPAVFGKKIGGDILCNKKTFMLITALVQAQEDDKEALLGWLHVEDYAPEEKIKAVTSIYNKVGVADSCNARIDVYYKEGLALLEQVDVEPARKEELKAFVCRLMDRKL